MYMHITHTHTHTHAAKQHIHSLTQPWNPLRLGILQNSSSILLLIYSPSPACKVQTEKNKRGKGTAVRLPETKQRLERETHKKDAGVWVSSSTNSIWISICSHWFSTGKDILRRFRRIALILHLIAYNSECLALTGSTKCASNLFLALRGWVQLF